MARTKSKRAEAAHRAASLSSAEGVAAGTMAGGLVLGALEGIGQARASEAGETEVGRHREQTSRSETGDQTAAANEVAPDHVDDREVVSVPNAPSSRTECAPSLDSSGFEAQGQSVSAPAAPSDAVPVISESGADADHVTAVPDTNAVDDAGVVGSSSNIACDLADRLTGQITSGMERIVEGISAGQDAGTLAKDLAVQISETVDNIVARLDLGRSDDAAQSIPDAGEIVELLPNIDTLTEDALGGIDGKIESALQGATETVDDIVAGLSPTLEDLASIPASILGAGSDTVADGLLEQLYYRDGEAEGIVLPAMPTSDADTTKAPVPDTATVVADVVAPDMVDDLSDAASDIISTIAHVEIGVIGQPYGETPDGSLPMLNALHLM